MNISPNPGGKLLTLSTLPVTVAAEATDAGDQGVWEEVSDLDHLCSQSWLLAQEFPGVT